MAKQKKAKPPAPKAGVWTVVSPREIASRLKQNQCLGCGLPGMNLPANIDPETGFTSQYCYNCRNHNRYAMRKTPGDVKAREQHRKDGIDNLDRLMGVKPS